MPTLAQTASTSSSSSEPSTSRSPAGTTTNLRSRKAKLAAVRRRRGGRLATEDLSESEGDGEGLAGALSDASDDSEGSNPLAVSDEEDSDLEAGIRTNGKKKVNGGAAKANGKGKGSYNGHSSATSASSASSPDSTKEGTQEVERRPEKSRYPRKVLKTSEGQSIMPFGSSPSSNGGVGKTVVVSQSSPWGSNSDAQKDRPTRHANVFHMLDLEQYANFHQLFPGMQFPAGVLNQMTQAQREGRPEGLENAPSVAAEAKFVKVMPSERAVEEKEDEDRDTERRERKKEKLKEKRAAKKAAASAAAALAREKAAVDEDPEAGPSSPALSAKPPSLAQDRRPSSRLSGVAAGDGSQPASPVQEPWQIPRVGRFWDHDDRAFRGGRGTRAGARGGRGRRGVVHGGQGMRADWEERKQGFAHRDRAESRYGDRDGLLRPDTPAGRSDRSVGSGAGWTTVQGRPGRGGFGAAPRGEEGGAGGEWRHDGWEEMEREEGYRAARGVYRGRGRGWRGGPNSIGYSPRFSRSPAGGDASGPHNFQSNDPSRPPEAPWTTKSPVPFLFNAPGSRQFTDSQTGRGIIEAQVAPVAGAGRGRGGKPAQSVRIELNGPLQGMHTVPTSTTPKDGEQLVVKLPPPSPKLARSVSLDQAPVAVMDALERTGGEDALAITPTEPDQPAQEANEALELLVDDSLPVSMSMASIAESWPAGGGDAVSAIARAPSTPPTAPATPSVLIRSEVSQLAEGQQVIYAADPGKVPEPRVDAVLTASDEEIELPGNVASPEAQQEHVQSNGVVPPLAPNAPVYPPPPPQGYAVPPNGYHQGYYPPPSMPFVDPVTGVPMPYPLPAPYGYAPPNQGGMYAPYPGAPMYDMYGGPPPPMPHGGPGSGPPGTPGSGPIPTPGLYVPARSTKVRISKPSTPGTPVSTAGSRTTSPAGTEKGESSAPPKSRQRRKMSFGSTFRGGSVSMQSELPLGPGTPDGQAQPMPYYEHNGVTYFQPPPPPPPMYPVYDYYGSAPQPLGGAQPGQGPRLEDPSIVSQGAPTNYYGGYNGYGGPTEYDGYATQQ